MPDFNSLDKIADLMRVANKSAKRHRDECPDLRSANAVDMKSYNEGQAAAYNEAHRVMKAELERLQNLFQNNALTLNDFRTY